MYCTFVLRILFKEWRRPLFEIWANFEPSCRIWPNLPAPLSLSDYVKIWKPLPNSLPGLAQPRHLQNIHSLILSTVMIPHWSLAMTLPAVHWHGAADLYQLCGHLFDTHLEVIYLISGAAITSWTQPETWTYNTVMPWVQEQEFSLQIKI